MSLVGLGTAEINTAWRVSKYWVFSDPYFSVFGLNIGKYEPEKKTPCMDTFLHSESQSNDGLKSLIFNMTI